MAFEKAKVSIDLEEYEYLKEQKNINESEYDLQCHSLITEDEMSEVINAIIKGNMNNRLSAEIDHLRFTKGIEVDINYSSAQPYIRIKKK